MEANKTHFEECNILYKNSHNLLHGYSTDTKTFIIASVDLCESKLVVISKEGRINIDL